MVADRQTPKQFSFTMVDGGDTWHSNWKRRRRSWNISINLEESCGNSLTPPPPPVCLLLIKLRHSIKKFYSNIWVYRKPIAKPHIKYVAERIVLTGKAGSDYSRGTLIRQRPIVVTQSSIVHVLKVSSVLSIPPRPWSSAFKTIPNQ